MPADNFRSPLLGISSEKATNQLLTSWRRKGRSDARVGEHVLFTAEHTPTTVTGCSKSELHVPTSCQRAPAFAGREICCQVLSLIGKVSRFILRSGGRSCRMTEKKQKRRKGINTFANSEPFELQCGQDKGLFAHAFGWSGGPPELIVVVAPEGRLPTEHDLTPEAVTGQAGRCRKKTNAIQDQVPKETLRLGIGHYPQAP